MQNNKPTKKHASLETRELESARFSRARVYKLFLGLALIDLSDYHEKAGDVLTADTCLEQAISILRSYCLEPKDTPVLLHPTRDYFENLLSSIEVGGTLPSSRIRIG